LEFRQSSVPATPLLSWAGFAVKSEVKTAGARGAGGQSKKMPMFRWLAMVIAAAALAGCAFGYDWADTTGHHRSGARAQSDYKACAAEAGIAGLDGNSTYDETAAVRRHLLACMFSRGWRATSLQHL